MAKRPMAEGVDRILGIIDVGLQASDEHGYGTDIGCCARCQCCPPAGDGELCDGCRAFLLEDSDEDPAAVPVWSDVSGAQYSFAQWWGLR